MTYSGLVRFQMTLATILTELMGAAVFERFPNIRMVLGESGIGWIPYVIDRMDFEYKDQYQDLKLKKLPSEYWRNQCRATFQYDRIGTKLIEDMGVETLMWGSDFPHPDGVWPELAKYIESSSGSAGGCRLQDDLRERRQVLRADQLTRAAPRAACVDPAKAAIHRRTTADPAGNPRGVFRCGMRSDFSERYRTRARAGPKSPIRHGARPAPRFTFTHRSSANTGSPGRLGQPFLARDAVRQCPRADHRARP